MALSTGSAREKMEKVADFIEELHGLASKEVGNTDQLALTVRYHGEFMRQNLLEYARALFPAETRAVVSSPAQA